MFNNLFDPEYVSQAFKILQNEFPLAIWETLYVTVLATFFAIVLGLPLGVILVTGDEKGVAPLPKWLMKVIGVIINLLRSVPFLILMILVIPITRAIAGKAYGSNATVVPLVIAAAPYVARMIESSLL